MIRISYLIRSPLVKLTISNISNFRIVENKKSEKKNKH